MRGERTLSKKKSIIKTWRCKVMDDEESSVQRQEGNRSRNGQKFISPAYIN